MDDFRKDKEVINVPFVVYESAMTRAERHAKRLVIVLIMTIILLFISNGCWLYAWTQYDYIGEEITYSQDGKGVNVIGDNNGTTINDKTQDP